MSCASLCICSDGKARMSCALESDMNVRRCRVLSAAQLPGGVEGRDSDGCDMMHLATRFDDIELAGLALARGCIPNAALSRIRAGTPFIKTALMVAADHNSHRVLKMLLCREDVCLEANLTDQCGFDAFHIAVERGHTEVVKLLVDALGWDHVYKNDSTAYRRNKMTLFGPDGVLYRSWNTQMFASTVGLAVTTQSNSVDLLMLLRSYGAQPCPMPPYHLPERFPDMQHNFDYLQSWIVDRTGLKGQ